jgi:hypothetical protein
MTEIIESIGQPLGIWNNDPKELKDVLEMNDDLKNAMPLSFQIELNKRIKLYESQMTPFFTAFKAPLVYKKQKAHYKFNGKDLPIPSVKQQFYESNALFYTNQIMPLLKEVVKYYDNSISLSSKEFDKPTSKINKLKKLKEERAYQLSQKFIREGDFVDRSLKAQIEKLEKDLGGIGENEIINSSLLAYEKRSVISNLLDEVEKEIYRNNEASHEAKDDLELNYEHDGYIGWAADKIKSAFTPNFLKKSK